MILDEEFISKATKLKNQIMFNNVFKTIQFVNK